MPAKVFKLFSLAASELEELAAGLRSGKIMVFPTDTVYGIGGSALSAGVHQRIVSIKKRSPSKPLPILVESPHQAKDLVHFWPPAAESLSRRFWPGPLTMVLRASPFGRKAVQRGDSIGIRVPGPSELLRVIAAVGAPLASSSANISDRSSIRDCREAVEAFGSSVDFILDGGPGRQTAAGERFPASTVVDLTVSPPRILREGVLSSDEVLSTVRALPSQD